MKLLTFHDSPTIPTGFSCVAKNLIPRWLKAGVEVETWGIGFNGWGYTQFPWKIMPGGGGGDWHTVQRLELFLKQLSAGGYTHVWMMQDTFALSHSEFPKAFQQICKEKNIRSVYYFPVDAPLEPHWTDMIAAVDCPVAYTEYGRREAIARGVTRGHDLKHLRVIPHGVDTSVFKPFDQEHRDHLRAPGHFKDGHMYATPFARPGDFVMLNVNVHQRRKDVTRSLQILAELKRQGIPAKLIMHMKRVSEGVDLENVAENLGLVNGVDWGHHDHIFPGGGSLIKDHQLPMLYNYADLYLSTSLGEGWGLGITEALACGLPVALPNHTACAEIAGKLDSKGMGDRVLPLEVEKHPLILECDNSRPRHRVIVDSAADDIMDFYLSKKWKERPALNPQVKEWLSWDRIAAEMFKALKGE